MTEPIEIDAIRPILSADAARARVLRRSPALAVGAGAPLYYPYDWTEWSVRTPSLWGRRELSASCLVDGLSGRAATTDAFEVVRVDATGATVLAREVEEGALLEAARRYLVHAAVVGARCLAVPGLELRDRRTVHRPFWILSCHRSGREGARFRTLVDASTGALHTLPPAGSGPGA